MVEVAVQAVWFGNEPQVRVRIRDRVPDMDFRTMWRGQVEPHYPEMKTQMGVYLTRLRERAIEFGQRP